MLNKIKVYLRLVMFSHTLFSLPFAICALLLIHPNLKLYFLTVLSLVSARTLANALNRIVDMSIDIRNPRTAERPLCTGEISITDTCIFTLVTAIVFLISVIFINVQLVTFLPLLVLLFIFYALTKRITAACHFILGFICSLSVVGVCLACNSPIYWRLAAACALSVTGFDILYAIDDIEFDRAFGLHSIPAALGERQSVLVSAACLFASSYFSGTFLLSAGLCAYLISTASIVLAFMGYYKFAAYRMNQYAGVIRLLVFGINYTKI